MLNETFYVIFKHICFEFSHQAEVGHQIALFWLLTDYLEDRPIDGRTLSEVPPLTYLVTAKPVCLRFYSSHASHPIRREKVIIATLRSQS